MWVILHPAGVRIMTIVSTFRLETVFPRKVPEVSEIVSTQASSPEAPLR